VLEYEIIESARSGGPALERLLVAIWPEAYRTALSMLRDRGLAEDAAQDACAAIARSLPSLKDTRTFRAWMYKIVVNHSITAARRRPQTQTLDSLGDRGIQFDQSDALDLYDALAALPIVQRSAIILFYFADLTSGEIAAATGLPSSTIRFHLMLARRALRKALSVVESRSPEPSKEVLSDVH